jgi:hypothetical protein
MNERKPDKAIQNGPAARLMFDVCGIDATEAMIADLAKHITYANRSYGIANYDDYDNQCKTIRGILKLPWVYRVGEQMNEERKDSNGPTLGAETGTR